MTVTKPVSRAERHSRIRCIPVFLSWVLGLRVQGVGFRASDLGSHFEFRVEGLVFGERPYT